MRKSQSLGERIREARQGDASRETITQERLAALVGVTKNTVGKWERGESEPLWSQLGAIGDVCGVPMAYFAETWGGRR
jgi:transcriptional regulator with XRE-family HTH domain